MPADPVPLPSLAELQDAAYVLRLPMRVRFRGLLEREVLLLRGPSGWGEFGPFVEYDDVEAARWLAAGIEAAWGAWPAGVRESVAVNATVPAVAPDAVAGVLARFPGATTAKVKVAEAGQSLADDLARVAAVRDALGAGTAGAGTAGAGTAGAGTAGAGTAGAGGRIRVDANGGWSVPEALEALPRLAAAARPATFEYAEQPCASIAELADVRSGLARGGHDILIAADESVRKAEDPLRVAVAGAADVVMLKVAPLGGVRAALAVAAELGERHGLPVVVSSALDTSVGIGAGLALAAALPALPYACGLATVGLFAQDVCGAPLSARDGSIAVRRGVPDADRLRELAAPAGRETWWRERLARGHALLATVRHE